ncbi:MAG: hypothetical protein KF699_10690 [Phycisphaeraceae bacterium]|nr:hypothetical protein [Phycisphaeraceae bacterium]MBX3407099.1 hypothetical protein [Phycisphaeraceae bacterium]
MHTRVFIAACVLAAATAANAQTDVHPGGKRSWSENCGWMNWRDAAAHPLPPGSAGVRLHQAHLSGMIWCENIGWMNIGPAQPSGPGGHANLSGADFGVNIDPATGHLSGYAWSENAGWINFAGGAMATPANPARLDSAAHRLRGFAWGENIGWINLDAAAAGAFVAIGCPADFNLDGEVNVPDIFAFLVAWFAGDHAADFDASGGVAVPDIFAFLVAWFAGCA